MLIRAVLSLVSALTTLAGLSAPFCVIQLALCKLCPVKALRLAPPVLFGAGFLWSCWYLDKPRDVDRLLGLMVIVPCILGLIGSGAGWALWKWMRAGLK